MSPSLGVSSPGGLRNLGYNQGIGCIFWGGKNEKVVKRCWRIATNEFLCCFKAFKLYFSYVSYEHKSSEQQKDNKRK